MIFIEIRSYSGPHRTCKLHYTWLGARAKGAANAPYTTVCVIKTLAAKTLRLSTFCTSAAPDVRFAQPPHLPPSDSSNSSQFEERVRTLETLVEKLQQFEERVRTFEEVAFPLAAFTKYLNEVFLSC